MKTIHLVCNAHLDPVWLWQWQEGAAEAISTFRVAADFCEEFDGFVFNHNEVILYRWVQEYEPQLFKRIQKLVRQGKWHIMGGWYLQPDCNMPSGESFVRQALIGRRYFDKHFGVRPTTAINFDPFGHTRGLVQILAKSGYDSYLFTRPGDDFCKVDENAFLWEGYDGSQIMAQRKPDGYLSFMGKACEKTQETIDANERDDEAIVLWGVGNHGGGPSRIDLQQVTKMIADRDDVNIVHSTPEKYFAQVAKKRDELPVRREDLNPWAVGCYTSQIRIKQKHRQMENDQFLAEKMATAAWKLTQMEYPAEELAEAGRDLATMQFHDILPGSSIAPAEEDALMMAGHALDILSRLKARSFFSLASGQKVAKGTDIPVLVYNPHPYPVKTIVECEMQLQNMNFTGSFTNLVVHKGNKALPSQVENEHSNLNLDWRKRVTFAAELAPCSMNRFDCRAEVLPAAPKPKLKATNGKITFKTDAHKVVINAKTGFIDSYTVGGVEQVKPGAFKPIVMLDDEDPWGMRVRSYRKPAGKFKLLSRKRAGWLAGRGDQSLDAVRVIEDGPARSVIEVLLGWENSFICQHYLLSKHSTEIEVLTRVFWNEKDRILKLSIPTPDKDAGYRGQVAYGVEDLPNNGDEVVTHKWVAAVSKARSTALTCIDDGIYGSDCKNGEVRLSLLRSPAYSCHPIDDKPLLPDDRFSPRSDQGERLYRFWVNAGPATQRLAAIDREAQARNEKPMALSFFPSGAGEKPGTMVKLSDSAVQSTVLKKSEDGDALIIRLFEPTGQKRTTTVSLPFAGISEKITLGAFEIVTLKADTRKKTVTRVNLMEEKI